MTNCLRNMLDILLHMGLSVGETYVVHQFRVLPLRLVMSEHWEPV